MNKTGVKVYSARMSLPHDVALWIQSRIGIESRLRLGLVVLIVLAGTAMPWLALRFAADSIDRAYGQKRFEHLADTAQVVDDALESRRALLRTLARALEAGQIDTSAHAQQALDRFPMLLSEFGRVSLVDSQGLVVANLNGSEHDNRLNVGDREYFARTVSTRSGQVSHPIRSRLTDEPQIILTEPVFALDGHVQGVISAGLMLDRPIFDSNRLNATRDTSSTEFIVDASGLLIKYPQSRLLATDARKLPQWGDVIGLALGGFDGLYKVDSRSAGGEFLFYRPAKIDWIIGRFVPDAQLNEPVQNINRVMLWLGSIASICSAIVALLVVSRYFSPLTKLEDKMRSLVNEGSEDEAVASNYTTMLEAFDAIVASRKSTQDRLRTSELYLKEILLHASDAFATLDAEGRITEWNRQAELMFSVDRDQALGQALNDLVQLRVERPAKSEGVGRETRMWLSLRDARTEGTITTRNGETVYVEVFISSAQIGPGRASAVFIRDVTKRRSAERARQQLERRLNTIADNMPACISHIGPDLCYTYANAGYKTYLNLDPKEIIGKPLVDVYGPSFIESVKIHLEAVLAGSEVTYQIRDPNQEEDHFYKVHYIPDFDESGKVSGFYSMVLDTTAQRIAERTLEASERQLRTITNNLPGIVAYIDKAHVLRFANATFERWVGVNLPDALNRPVGEVLGNGLNELYASYVERGLAGERLEFETAITYKGQYRWLRSVYVPDIRANGRVEGIYALGTDITALKDAQSELERLARFDILTGLPNRRHFAERLGLTLTRVERLDPPPALIFIDVDHFKAINDSFGHAGGDWVLAEIARRLDGNIRKSDLAARLAGDEFVVLLETLTSPDDAKEVANKLLLAIRAPIEFEGRQLVVTCSMGIASLVTGDTVESVLDRADVALYEAKASGRNAVRGVTSMVSDV